MRFTITLAIIALFLPMPMSTWAGDNNGANGENWCDDHPVECICSETLDCALGTFSGVVNPSCSTSKQCGPSGNGNAISSNSNSSFVAETEMPAGNTVTNVLAWPLSANTAEIDCSEGNLSSQSSTTFCTRYYEKFGNGTGTNYFLSGHRIKLTQIDFQTNSAQAGNPNFFLQSEMRGGGQGTNHPIPETLTCSGEGQGITPTGDSIVIDDVYDSWWRVEQCVDWSGTHAEFRLRYTVLSSGHQLTFSSVGGADCEPGNTFTDITANGHCWFGNTAHSIIDQQPADPYRYSSYAVAAMFNYDSTHTTWIGPASEVEGAGVTPFSLDSFTLINPSTCVQGNCAAKADLNASGSNGSGNISWLVDCHYDGVTFNGVDPDGVVGAGGANCVNSLTCGKTDVCDYSADSASTKTARLCATRGTDPQSCRTTTFQIQSPPATPGNNAGGRYSIHSMLEWSLELYHNPSPVVAL